jgi:hypothetical protein
MTRAELIALRAKEFHGSSLDAAAAKNLNDAADRVELRLIKFEKDFPTQGQSAVEVARRAMLSSQVTELREMAREASRIAAHSFNTKESPDFASDHPGG